MRDFRNLSKAESMVKSTTGLNKLLLIKLSTSNRGRTARWPRDNYATKLLFKTRSIKPNKWGLRKLKKSSEETMITKWPNSHPSKTPKASI